ncbi:MAG: hypothetical protein M1814_000097 [Vezdaea aestivalis]|nr:MAG: hypothetical protein M1814_000097 [Vezdaea aestivalis]
MLVGITAATLAFSFLIYRHSPGFHIKVSQCIRRWRAGPPPSVTVQAISEPSPDTTPKASPTVRPQTPPSPPSFPALNSAQRAGNGQAHIPQPVPPKLSALNMPPPPRPNPLPNRGRGTQLSRTNGSLALPPTATQIPPKPSKKVLLAPGHSPLDWARLTAEGSDLRGLPPGSPLLRVRPSELSKHNKRSDAWMVLAGKVYNVTPYMGFHPGGERELMKGAGRDGKKLFMEVHPWVNYEGMLAHCLVGIAVDEVEETGSGTLEDID